jgi:hypothetical protein
MPRKRNPSRSMPQNGAALRPETIATRWLRQMVVSQKDEAIRAGIVPDGDAIRLSVAKGIRDAISGADQAARDKASAISTIALDRYIVDAAGDILRSGRVEGMVAWNGQVAPTDVAERLSIPPRDSNGARVKKPGTYPMWLSVPRAEYLAKVADVDLAYDQDGLRRALLHKGAAYLNAHPTASTLTFLDIAP